MLGTHDTKISDAVRDHGFTPDCAWWQRLFVAIDAGDVAAFLELLTPDAQFRFGNAAETIGRQAIGDAVTGFFQGIASSQHRLLETWSVGGRAGCEGEVTYTRHDGSVVTFPFANVFKLRGDKICTYRIYIDNSPLFAAAP